MAEVNEYFKDKYETEQKEFKKKISRHRRLIVYRILCLIGVVCVLLFLIYNNYKKKIYTDYEILRTMVYTEASGTRFLEFNGNVLRYSRDGASAFNMENDMLWNQTYEMQSPMVDVCGDYVALGDYMGTKIYVLNGTGLQGEIDTTLSVQRFCVAGNGNVAVVLEENDVTWVKLYNVDGQEIANDRTTMAKSGYPISIDISEDGIMLSVSYLYIDSGEISSSVAYYNFGAVGQNEIDNLVSGYNYSDEVITYTKFINEDTSFALGSTHFEIFKGKQKPENVSSIELEDEVSSVFYGKNNIGLVYTTGTLDDPYRVDVYDTQGQLVLSQPFSLEYTDMVFNKDIVIIYNSSECVMYNLEGVQKYKGLFKNSILNLIPTNVKTKYLLVSGGKTDEIQLK